MAFLKQWPNDDDANKHLAEIAEFRTALKDVFAAHPDQELVLEAVHIDRCCLRFLRARKYVLSAAVDQFRRALALRVKQRVDATLRSPFAQAVAFNRKLVRGFHGFDKAGHPILIERIGQLELEEMYKVVGVHDDTARLAYSRYQAEYIHKILLPLASERAGKRIDQVCILVDMKGFGHKHIRTREYHFFHALSSNDSLMYPERMAYTMIINAPIVFSMVWKIVSGWMDQQMRAKFLIYSSGAHTEAMKELTQRIDAEQLPACLGGSCKCCNNSNGSRNNTIPTAIHSRSSSSSSTSASAGNDHSWDPDGCLMGSAEMRAFFQFCRTGLGTDADTPATTTSTDDSRHQGVSNGTVNVANGSSHHDDQQNDGLTLEQQTEIAAMMESVEMKEAGPEK